jgi:hypothetical protein
MPAIPVPMTANAHWFESYAMIGFVCRHLVDIRLDPSGEKVLPRNISVSRRAGQAFLAG